MEGVIGEIRWFAGNFAPKNWAFCQGQTINISANTALFSILGTTYGGNGTTNFMLPDFQSRVAVGAGQGPGTSVYGLGQKGGFESTVLTAQQLPAHAHMAMVQLTGTENDANSSELNGQVFATAGANVYASGQSATNKLAPFNATVTHAGSNQPISLIQPSLGMNFIICLYGVFPSRS